MHFLPIDPQKALHTLGLEIQASVRQLLTVVMLVDTVLWKPHLFQLFLKQFDFRLGCGCVRRWRNALHHVHVAEEEVGHVVVWQAPSEFREHLTFLLVIQLGVDGDPYLLKLGHEDA